MQGGFLGSNLSTRINIAYALDLYDHETRNRLHDVRCIRNDFAHPSTSAPLDFNTKRLKDKCAKLPLTSIPEPDSSRNRYIHYLEEVGDRLWNTLEELRKRTNSA